MYGKSKKVSLSKMQRNMLLEVEESGECEFVSLINSVRSKENQEDYELELFRSSLKGLLRLGFIILCKEYRGPPCRLEPVGGYINALIDECVESLVWKNDEQSFIWNTKEFFGASDVYVCLTKQGEEAIFT